MGEARRVMCVVHGQTRAMLQTDLEIDVEIDGRCKRKERHIDANATPMQGWHRRMATKVNDGNRGNLRRRVIISSE
jgi:hypothetical protein